MAKTLEPNVVNEPKQKIVMPLNEQDVEAIVKKYIEQHPELIPSQENKVEDFVEIKDILTDEEAELTPEIYAVIEKAFKVGKVKDSSLGYYFFINFAFIENGEISDLCFGCTTALTTNAHVKDGAHLEIAIYREISGTTYKAKLTEI